ncbi:hypothetical protein [uncultured Draconibacterium sp.]|uniref:hypothetical protein n=1 Tax=uncultured Draconibacterium sp. TaxID=1573823 RepID=UPI0029C63E45|nr:hypothetical protein [uncultured Draconibacterium sp.]
MKFKNILFLLTAALVAFSGCKSSIGEKVVAETDLQHTNDLINLEVMQVKMQVEEAYESILLTQKSVTEAEGSMNEPEASIEVLKTKWQSVTGNLYIPEEEN